LTIKLNQFQKKKKKAVRARCTLGEISSALEKEWKRYLPPTRMVSGAYKNEYGESDEITKTLKAVEVIFFFQKKIK